MREYPLAMRWISVSELKIDERYQRSLLQDKISKIAKEWDWTACGAISVAKRGNELFVVDGQHRIEAVKKVMGSEARVPCVVHDPRKSSVESEAETFLKTNTARRGLTFADKFKALLAKGDTIAIEMNAAVKSLGRNIQTKGYANKSDPRILHFPSSLYSAWKKDAERAFLILQVTIDISGDEYVYRELFDGIFLFSRWIEDKYPEIPFDKWSSRLKKIGRARLLDACRRFAIALKSRTSRGWAFGIVDEYNRGLHSKLDLP